MSTALTLAAVIIGPAAAILAMVGSILGPDDGETREELAARTSRGWPDDDPRWRRCPDCDCGHGVELPDGTFYCPACDGGPDDDPREPECAGPLAALGVSVTVCRSAGIDGAPVVLVDTAEDLDGPDGPRIRILVNDWPVYVGAEYDGGPE